jgi:hypothetical protein
MQNIAHTELNDENHPTKWWLHEVCKCMMVNKFIKSYKKLSFLLTNIPNALNGEAFETLLLFSPFFHH